MKTFHQWVGLYLTKILHPLSWALSLHHTIHILLWLWCYISVHSTTTTPPTSLTPLTLTPTYTSFTLTTFSYLQILTMISSSALTASLSLIPIPSNYCSLPYLFLVLWPSLTNLSLALQYHITNYISALVCFCYCQGIPLVSNSGCT